MPKRKNEPVKRSALATFGKILLAAVPLLGLGWAITDRMLSRSEKVKETLASGYVRLEGDALFDLVSGDPAVLRAPGVVRQNSGIGLTKTLHDAFTPEAVNKNGVTIAAASFLLVTNRGTSRVQSVTLETLRGPTNLGALDPQQSIAYCVAIEPLGSAAIHDPVRKVTFATAGGTATHEPQPLPSREQMTTEIGGRGDVRLFYPPAQ